MIYKIPKITFNGCNLYFTICLFNRDNSNQVYKPNQILIHYNIQTFNDNIFLYLD